MALMSYDHIDCFIFFYVLYKLTTIEVPLQIFLHHFSFQHVGYKLQRSYGYGLRRSVGYELRRSVAYELQRPRSNGYSLRPLLKVNTLLYNFSVSDLRMTLGAYDGR